MFLLAADQQEIAFLHAPERYIGKSLDESPKHHAEIVRRHEVIVKPLGEDPILFNLGLNPLIVLLRSEIGEARYPGYGGCGGEYSEFFGRLQNIFAPTVRNLLFPFVFDLFAMTSVPRPPMQGIDGPAIIP